MITIKDYQPSDKVSWDQCVSTSKNGAFLFFRDYMDYHADRFTDASILILNDNKVIGVLPANRVGDQIVSHGGLTFGGIICTPAMTMGRMLEAFEALIRHLRDQGINTLLYKASPSFYHRYPSQEDLYALSAYNACLVRRDVGSVIRPTEVAAYQRKQSLAINKTRNAGCIVVESRDFAAYWQILATVLDVKHSATPVHNLQEIELLASHFLENIRLFLVKQNETILAGTIIFENDGVAHTQYQASTVAGHKLRALDFLLYSLITEHFRHKEWFSFGTSTEDGGKIPNAGLMEYKEKLGARACVQDFYLLNLQN